MVGPWERFRLANADPALEPTPPPPVADTDTTAPVATRPAGRNGLISIAAANYKAAVWLSGQDVVAPANSGPLANPGGRPRRINGA
jgi:hypothetical protein